MVDYQAEEGALDAKRGKIFTKIIKEISIAAREGGAEPVIIHVCAWQYRTPKAQICQKRMWNGPLKKVLVLTALIMWKLLMKAMPATE
jgi:hypothetical protein